MKVATGLAIGSKTSPELAAQAVLTAISKAELVTPACVLLFLSSEISLFITKSSNIWDSFLGSKPYK